MTRILQSNKVIENLKVQELSVKFGLDKILIEFLINNNFDTDEKILSYLYDSIDNLSSPFCYTNMDKVVKRLQKAQKNKERILIYGDYDCDGIGAIAIFYLACKAHNIILDYFIPTRAIDGYGLNFDSLKKIKEDFNPDLLVTVDCGITAVSEIEYAKSLGMDVIVTDHHQPSDTLPSCIIVNPCFDKNCTPLCGAGVAIRIVEAWLGKETAMQYLDICAISTIADVVPLIGDNRIIAKYGMQRIKKGNCRKGLKELIFTANADYRKISTYDMAYKIAPRINASGRLNSANTSLSLLIEEDSTMINLLAKELEIQNTKRQALNAEIYEQAKIMLKNYDLSVNKLIVLYNKDWNEGVLGIVAAKITEEFNRPTVLLTQKENIILKGSARSIQNINIFEVFNHCKDYFLGFGGHSMAAGLQLKEENLSNFIDCANDFLKNNYKDSDFEKTVYYDFMLPIKKFTAQLGKQLSLFEPFGCGNQKPVFFDNAFKGEFKRIGKTEHIKSNVINGEIVLFGQGERLSYYNGNELKIAYTQSINIFREREYNQFSPKAIIPSIDFIPDDAKLYENYIKTLLYNNYNNANGKMPYKKDGNGACLYITFNKNSFLNMIKTNDNIEKFIFTNDYLCTRDTVVLCPNKSFDFAYYNKIVLLERMSANYIEFLKGEVANLEIVGDKPPYFENDFTNIEILRDDYKFFNRILSQEYKYINNEEFYAFCQKYGYAKDFNVFLSSLYVFIDVELIKKNENDILSVERHKVNMEESRIFKILVAKDF